MKKTIVINVLLLTLLFMSGENLCRKMEQKQIEYEKQYEIQYSTSTYDENMKIINDFKRKLEENYTLKHHKMWKTFETFTYVSTNNDIEINIRQEWKKYQQFDKTVITIEKNGEIIQEQTISYRIF